jgi:acetyl esterase/lipase
MSLLQQLQEQTTLGTSFTTATVKALLRRRQYGPRHHNWSWTLEGIVDMMINAVPNRAEIDVHEIRTLFARTATLPVLTPVQSKTIRLGTVPGERQVPPRMSKGRTILFFHGGGYIAGSPRSHRLLTTRIAAEAAAQLFSMDYRLAPEHPYPAALEDAQQAYRALLKQGVSPHQLVVGGDSAGAGLAIALLLALRETDVPLPAAAFCLSPLFDLSCDNAAKRANVASDYLNLHVVRCSANSYLGGADPYQPLASPLHADLQGLPPLLLQAGSTELLVDDALQFAERAAAANVDVQLNVAHYMIHVYQFLHQIVPEANAAVKQIGQFVRAQTTRHPTSPTALFEPDLAHSAPARGSRRSRALRARIG